MAEDKTPPIPEGSENSEENGSKEGENLFAIVTEALKGPGEAEDSQEQEAEAPATLPAGDSAMADVPLDDDDDLFGAPPPEKMEEVKDDLFGAPPPEKKEEIKEDDFFGAPPPKKEEPEEDDDLFGSGTTKTPKKQAEADDLFSSAVSSPASAQPVASSPATLPSNPSPPPSVSELQPATLTATASAPVAAESKPEPAAASTASTSEGATAARKDSGTTFKKARAKSQDSAKSQDDGHTINITVTEPHKVGDGMGAFMSYRVITKTNIPAFRKPSYEVNRRFSDFLGLHTKLSAKHTHEGRIVPPAPEKSIIGMTKVKMSKEESGSAEFVEKRRAALERYLQRTALHPVLRLDPDFRDFLETEAELPKATNTQALSGAGVLRFFTKVGDGISKMATTLEESDPWFEDKKQTVEAMETQLRKMHASVDSLVHFRKDLASSSSQFSRSTALLGTAEEHGSLSRALAQLSELQERVQALHARQADVDYYTLAEGVKDYLALIHAIKAAFGERAKLYKNWKDCEAALTKKREAKARLELAHKTDKIPAAEQEIREWEEKVEKGQEEFDRVSETLRKELARFERQRVEDFKTMIVTYLESLLNNQDQLIKVWEGFLPEAKAIA